MTGNSGSRREASPSAARSRSSNTKPLTPSKLRSSTTSAGWRTSIALRPSPTLLAPATRNPSAAKLSSRNARVSSSSSTTKIRRCASIPTRRTATQNLAPFAQVSPGADPSSRWGPVKSAGERPTLVGLRSSRDVIGVSDHVLDAVARALHWTTERVHPTVSPGATAAARGRYRWHHNPALRHLLDAGSPTRPTSSTAAGNTSASLRRRRRQ